MQVCLRIQRGQLDEDFPVDRPLLHAHRFIHEYEQSAEDSLKLFLPGNHRDLATASNTKSISRGEEVYARSSISTISKSRRSCKMWHPFRCGDKLKGLTLAFVCPNVAIIEPFQFWPCPAQPDQSQHRTRLMFFSYSSQYRISK